MRFLAIDFCLFFTLFFQTLLQTNCAFVRENRVLFRQQEIADKARVILASLVGAVVVAKSISQEDERRKILQATQKQILALIGAKEDTLRTNTAL